LEGVARASGGRWGAGRAAVVDGPISEEGTI